MRRVERTLVQKSVNDIEEGRRWKTRAPSLSSFRSCHNAELAKARSEGIKQTQNASDELRDLRGLNKAPENQIHSVPKKSLGTSPSRRSKRERMTALESKRKTNAHTIKLKRKAIGGDNNAKERKADDVKFYWCTCRRNDRKSERTVISSQFFHYLL